MNVLCCAGNCLCQCISNICSDTMKINPKLFSRLGYIIMSLFFIAISLLILFYLPGILSPFKSFIHCPNDGSSKLDCLGISNVYRMSFALLVMHCLVILMSFCGGKCSEVVNQNCWTLKFLLVIAAYIIFFFIPNEVFIVYSQISRYVSVVFIMFQVMITISFAHVININLVNKLDNANETGNSGFKYKFGLIFLSLLFLGASVFWVIYSYLNFHNTYYNILIISLNCLLGIAFTVLSISNIVTRKRLLTSIYIFSYTTFLTYSALGSEPTPAKFKIEFLDIAIGLVYLFLALYFIGFYIKKEDNYNNNDILPESEKKEQEVEKALQNNPLIETESKEEKEKKNDNLIEKQEEEKNEKPDENVSKSYIYFHLFMGLMSIYYCMLFTNWNILENQSSTTVVEETWVSFWVKIATLILSNLLYIWVLVAPLIFKDREFTF